MLLLCAGVGAEGGRLSPALPWQPLQLDLEKYGISFIMPLI